MIKYATRGLIQNGKLLPLFEKLYLLILITLSSILYIFLFVRAKNKNYEPRGISLCLLNTTGIEKHEFSSVKNIILTISLVFGYLLIVMIMFIR